jgi:hypothetical protein
MTAAPEWSASKTVCWARLPEKPGDTPCELGLLRFAQAFLLQREGSIKCNAICNAIHPQAARTLDYPPDAGQAFNICAGDVMS